jgi:hypothetical protein
VRKTKDVSFNMLGAVAVFLAFVPAAFAQAAISIEPETPATTEAMLALPDAPSVLTAEAVPAGMRPAGSVFGASDPNAAASPHDTYILPGQTAPPLTPSDKVVLGIKDAFSPFALVAITVEAGYSHLTNSSPNYGTNSTAFAQRFGATAVRHTSEELFTDCIMANVFREDPRYYQMGRSHNVFTRMAYAATRVIVTRTDGGRTSPNLALLSGYAGAAGMTNLYYPQVNHGVNQTTQTFAGILEGAAISNLVSEFLDDTLQIVHLKKTK